MLIKKIKFFKRFDLFKIDKTTQQKYKQNLRQNANLPPFYKQSCADWPKNENIRGKKKKKRQNYFYAEDIKLHELPKKVSANSKVFGLRDTKTNQMSIQLSKPKFNANISQLLYLKNMAVTVFFIMFLFRENAQCTRNINIKMH